MQPRCKIDKAVTDPQTGQTGKENKRDRVMNELDFSSKQVLVVGGSSGIGNGIAQAFCAKGAQVHVCGTRAKASDYSAEEGSHLEGLQYASKGSLIIVSSTAAYHSTKGNPAYNASKTGAVGLTRTLGEAWAEHGIRVNGIAPGLVDTKMTKVTTENPKRLEGAIERIPLKRLGTPADMAGAALFLASPLSSYIVGQTLVVDGGLIL
jgi:NAD(P)-dependent dehydrogenase (short-subunit alcohol dehydrogenase family)